MMLPRTYGSWICSILCAITVAGCEPPDPHIISHTTMGALELGMSPEEIQSATGASPEPILTFDLDGETWSASYFVHKAGYSASRYLALCDASGLRFWGFLHEFERQNDAKVVAAARAAEDEYWKWWSARSRKSEEIGAPNR